MDDWPLPSDCSERLGFDYLAQCLRKFPTLFLYAREYNRMHGMDGSHAAEWFERVMGSLDLFIGYDRQVLVNSAGAEVLARWCYAYEKCTAECTKAEHWKGQKGQLKVEWGYMERYDVLKFWKAGPAIETADDRVMDSLKRDALFAKYFEKAKAAGAVGNG
jgi:hypothetical protein